MSPSSTFSRGRSTSSAQAAACPITSLTLSDTGADLKRGDTAYGTIVARNVGSRPCTITGYPGMTLTAGGGPVSTRLSKAPGIKPTTVRLAPGAGASFGFSHSLYQKQKAHCDKITGAHVYDPDGSGFRTTDTSFTECAGITAAALRPVPLVVGPFVSGAHGTLS